MEFEVTSLEDIKKIKEGEKVVLEGFDPNIPFVVRLKRSSLLSLAANGQIPNALQTVAYNLFFGEVNRKDKNIKLSELSEIYKIVAKSAMIEPSYKELEDAGIELTDLQLISIWNYCQRGITALEPFRKKYSNTKNIKNK